MSHYPAERDWRGAIGAPNATTIPPNANWAAAQQLDAVEAAGTVEGRLSNLASTIEWVAKIASQAEDIANRIAGSRPEKDGNTSKPSPVPNGLPDTLALLHENIGAHLSRIDAALTRTREALG